MIQYNNFFRSYIVRRQSQVFSPKFFKLNNIELPRGSILHYMPTDISDIGPNNDEILINKYQPTIYIEHVDEFIAKLGNPKKRVISINKVGKEYNTSHRRFRPLRNFKSVDGTINNLIIENYGLCQHLVTYRPSMFVNYYKWYNLFWTIMNRMAFLQSASDRHQFIYLELPSNFPTLQQLNTSEKRLTTGLDGSLESLSSIDDESNAIMFSQLIGDALESLAEGKVEYDYEYNDINKELSRLTNSSIDINKSNLKEAIEALDAYASKVMNFQPNLNISTLRAFKSHNDYWLLDFWIWLGYHREGSIFSMLDHNQLDKINIIIGNTGSYTILNLGIINGWRDTLANKDGSFNENKLNTFRKHFLKMFMILFEVKTGSGEDDVTENIIDDTTDDDKNDSSDERDKQDYANLTDTKKEEEEVVTVKSDNDQEDIQDTDVDERHSNRRKFTDDIDDSEFNIIKDIRIARTNTEDIPAKIEDGVLRYTELLSEQGLLSISEYKRFQKLAMKYKEIENPFGEGSLESLGHIPISALTNIGNMNMPDSVTIPDKGMLDSSLSHFNKNYIANVMQSDIANAVLHLQNKGIAIMDYNVETIEDSLTKYYSYSVQVQGVGGKVSTIRFRIPVVNEDGSIVINGVKSRLSKQKADIPIKKVTDSRVAVTSYYGKLFIDRSSKSVYNYSSWLVKQINLNSVIDNPIIKNVKLGRYNNTTLKVPHVYTILSSHFKHFDINDNIKFMFDPTELEKIASESIREYYYKLGMVVCGLYDSKYLLMDNNNTLYTAMKDKIEILGDIETLLGIDISKAPTEMIEAKILGKYIPVGVILAYYYGLSNMVDKLNLNVRYVLRGDKLNLSDDERRISFQDEHIVYNRNDRLCSMLLEGFNAYHRHISQFSRYDFDKQSVYTNLLFLDGLSARWIQELDDMRDLFIDPITKAELDRRNQPTKLEDIYVYALNMLLTDEHLKETEEQRIKGYERIAGAVTKELIKSAKQFKYKGNVAKTTVSLHPDAVWNSITKDTSTRLIEEVNPIHNVKENEILTYGGEGGRTSRSMVKRTREYLPSYMGIISEATTDDGNAGYTSYMSSNPLLTDLRGNTKPIDDNATAANIVSTVSLLMPALDRDSPKRAVFASVQHSQGMYCDKQIPQPYRTGQEQVIAHKVSDIFAAIAEKDGEVVEVNDDHIAVKYQDGTYKTVQLGMRYGKGSGTVYTQPVVTDLKVGHKVKTGDAISWNKNYFQRDDFNKNQVSYLNGIMSMTALMEDQFTYEDSSIISENTANKLHTRVCKLKQIMVSFDQEIRNLVSVGDEVSRDSILCTIENPVTANIGQFEEESYDSLRLLAAQTPIAKVDGVISKIEVIYKGDIDDMSESLGMITNLSNKRLAKLNKALRNNGPTTSSIKTNLRVDGVPLDKNKAVINIYIITPSPISVGDKGVFANQMKTTFGYVMSDESRTESGIPLGSIFSYKGEVNRIVNSMHITGTVNLYCWQVTRNAVAMFKEYKRNKGS